MQQPDTTPRIRQQPAEVASAERTALQVPVPADARTRPSRGVHAGAPRRALNIQTVTHEGLIWVDIMHPGAPEMEWLAENYGFHPLHLDDTISKLQRPKLDDADDYTFLVLHFPVYSKLARVTTASEVDLFVGLNYLITVHSGALKPLVRLFKQCQDDPSVRAASMGRSSGFLLYLIIHRLVDYCFPILNKIDVNIEQVEDKIFEEKVRQTVQNISILRRDIIAFRRVIKPLIPVIASLERKRRPFLNEDLEEYFGDISDQLSKIWDTLEEDKEVIEGLSDTLNSLTSNRINEIIKVLTLISVILLPLTLISGIFGMNVELPPLTFALIIGLMTAVMVGMLVLFRWRKWI